MTWARRIAHLVGLAIGAIGCGHAGIALDDGATVTVPAGAFVMGSDPLQRARAAELSAKAGTFGRDSARHLRHELSRRTVTLDAFAIMVRPVTQSEYHAYVLHTGAMEPFVDRAAWTAMNTGYSYAVVESSLWVGGEPSPQRGEHPAVLVARDEADGYCRWWAALRGGHGASPTEAQWEKTARGSDGRTFPWGDRFDPDWLNSAEAGRGGTTPVETFGASASPHGALDMAGNVLEWTRTPFDGASWVVKGGSHNTDAAASRAAARHGRPGGQRHPAIGFRCVFSAR